MLNQTRDKEESIGSKDPIPNQTEQLSVDRKTAKAKGLLDWLVLLLVNQV